MRLLFSPPAGEATGLLTLPGAEPPPERRDERLAEIRMCGISRHAVRFAADSSEPYALKSPGETLALASTSRRAAWPKLASPG